MSAVKHATSINVQCVMTLWHLVELLDSSKKRWMNTKKPSRPKFSCFHISCDFTFPDQSIPPIGVKMVIAPPAVPPPRCGSSPSIPKCYRWSLQNKNVARTDIILPTHLFRQSTSCSNPRLLHVLYNASCVATWDPAGRKVWGGTRPMISS